MAVTQDLKAAIRERQQAINTLPAALIVVANAYTLGQLRTAVNAMAPSYCADNTYTGGAAAPAMLTGTYADSATTENALYLLVVAMQKTRNAVVWGTFGTGTATSGWHATSAAAKADALAAYVFTPGGGGGGNHARDTYLAHDGGGAGYQAVIGVNVANVNIAGLWAGTTKTARLFAQAVAGGTFSDLGEITMAENMYGEVHDSGSFAGATYTTVNYVMESTAPTEWPADPGLGLAETQGYDLNQHVWVIEWDFTYPGGGSAPETGDYDAASVFPGQIVVSRQAGVDHAYQCIGVSPETWDDVTPAAGAFPAAPSDGDTYDDTANGLVWMYSAHDTEWYAEHAGRRLNSGQGITTHLVTVTAAATTYLYEFPEPYDDDVEFVVTATPQWQTSFWATRQTARWVQLNFGTAPVYASVCNLMVHAQRTKAMDHT